MRVRSEAWELRLPDDWREVESTPAKQYFESGDGSKGLYVVSWLVEPFDGGRARRSGEVERTSPGLDLRGSVEDSGKRDLDGLRAMAGYEWKTVDEQRTDDGAAVTLLLDNLAAGQNYRIVSLFLARAKLFVRVTFHDYLCEDYAVSHAYSSSILASVSLRD